MINPYHCYLTRRNKTFFSIYLSRETIEDFDRQIRGDGLPKGATLMVKMQDDTSVECTDILVEYRMPLDLPDI